MLKERSSHNLSMFIFYSQCSRGRTVGRPLRTKNRKIRTFFLTQESWDAHIFDPRRQKYAKGRSLFYTRASSIRNLKGRTNVKTSSFSKSKIYNALGAQNRSEQCLLRSGNRFGFHLYNVTIPDSL